MNDEPGENPPANPRMNAQNALPIRVYSRFIPTGCDPWAYGVLIPNSQLAILNSPTLRYATLGGYSSFRVPPSSF